MYNTEFEARVELESESTDLPEEVRAAMWVEAYNRGHSAGLDEVANCYARLVDFARTVFECGVRTTLRNLPPAF